MKMEKNEIKVNDVNFEKEVLDKSTKGPVIVDFLAAWCMPCSMLAPILEKLVKKYNGKFILAKLNVDENPKTSLKYNISAIPAVKMFKNGKIVDQFVGVLPESTLEKWLLKNLNGS